MQKKSNKPAKPLPSWIVVTARDPKLAKLVEDKLARELEKTKETKHETDSRH
jgi:hypothetical protein